MSNVIVSKRLNLRHFKQSDSSWLKNIFGDPRVMQFSEGVKPASWIESWLQTVQQDYAQRGYGLWAVTRKSDALPLGYCGLAYSADVCGQAEVTLGYRLIYSQWGNGYATEALCAVIDYSVNTLGLSRLVATIDPNNIASISVAKKAGLVYEKEVMYTGYSHPDHVYVLEQMLSRNE